MALSREDVLHVAQLAQLRLDDEEATAMLRDLEKIMGHVEQLQQLTTDQVAPTAHGAVVATPLREDVAAEEFDRARVLAEAPRHNDEGFAVPAFVDEG